MDWTTIAAWYAAAVGTMALLWNIITKLRDKGRLKIKCSYDEFFGDTRIVHRLHYRLTNKGSRPITVESVGYKSLKERVHFYIGSWVVSPLPHKLEPTEFTDVVVELHGDEPERARLGAFDSNEKFWKAIPRTLQKAMQLYEQHKNSSQH